MIFLAHKGQQKEKKRSRGKKKTSPPFPLCRRSQEEIKEGFFKVANVFLRGFVFQGAQILTSERIRILQ